MNSVMVDIETLDTKSSAIILSVGACRFNPFNSDEPHSKITWRPSIAEQYEAGRTMSDSTLEWWSKQDPEIFERALTEEGRIPVNQFFKEFNKYVATIQKIWCQGPQFDMVIIEHLYEQFNHHTSWQYWKIMDCRTLFQLMPSDPRKEIQVDAHDAAEDAYWQAVCVQKVISHYNMTVGHK
jgi:hypothetical protein